MKSPAWQTAMISLLRIEINPPKPLLLNFADRRAETPVREIYAMVELTDPFDPFPGVRDR